MDDGQTLAVETSVRSLTGKGIKGGYLFAVLEAFYAGDDFLLGGIGIRPTVNFNPLTFFQILVVLKEIRNLIEQE